MTKKLISLSLFDAFLPEGRVEQFLGNSDSLWHAFDRYGAERGFRTQQLFIISDGLPDNKPVSIQKGNTLFLLTPKRRLGVILRLIRDIRNASIVLLHNESYLDILVAVLAKVYGAQVIVFYHNPHDPYDHKLPKWIFRFFLRKAVDALFMHSYEMKRAFKLITSRPVFIFKFGFDPELFPYVEREPEQKLRVVTVGRISPWKRVEDIIEGVALAASKLEIDLTIVGEDPDPTQKYFTLIKERLVRSGVQYKLAGFMPHSVLRQAYHDSDVFVNMRPDEGFARVFIEAMATGLPVVCRRGPVAEKLVVNGVNGFIVDSPAELADVLDKLAGDRALLRTLGREARAFVQRGYTWEASYMSLANAFDALLAGYEVEGRFYDKKAWKKLRRIKRLLLNQRVDSCNHVVIDGKLMETEQYALLDYCRGRGIDVGCGSNKTHPDAIGVDITAKGALGQFGNQRGQPSAADISASGDDLNMFRDGELDYVVARHNLEHYQDPIKTLREWKRVVRTGGVIGIVVPDDTWCDTIHLDPTHYHVFTPESFRTIIELIGGLKILKLETCIEDWSFVCVMEKTR